MEFAFSRAFNWYAELGETGKHARTIYLRCIEDNCPIVSFRSSLVFMPNLYIAEASFERLKLAAGFIGNVANEYTNVQRSPPIVDSKGAKNFVY